MADNIFSKAAGLFSKRASPTQTLGTSRTSTSVLSGEGAGTFDPPADDFRLNGPQRFDEFERLVRNVAIVGAGARLFLNMISNAVWTVNPPPDLTGNEETAAQDYADMAYADLFSMTTSWAAVVRKTAGFRLYGFAIQEWTAVKKPDGHIGFLDIEHRPQKTIQQWARDDGGTVEAVVQRVPGRKDVTLPRSKLVYAVDDTLTDSPEGLGLFAQLAATAARLITFLELEETGFTTDLRGIPIARAPLAELRQEVIDAGPEGSAARASAESRRSQLLQPLRNWLEKHVRNERSGMLMPSDTYKSTTPDKSTAPSNVPKWALELLSGDSTSFDSMANAINRLNQECARLMGVEHLLLGADGAGSLALGKTKMGSFYLMLTGALMDLCEVYDRDVLTPWADLNGVPEHLRPEMGVNEISDRDVDQVLQGLKDLAVAGAPLMPDDPAVGEIYDMLGLTRPPEREDDMDLSLTPGGPDDPEADPEPDPDDPEADMPDNPEEPVAKARVLRARSRYGKGGRKRSKA